MKAENFSISIGDKGVIAGNSHGEGERLLICFHGFGQSRKLFLQILPLVSKDCRVVTIDLPFFGESEWPDQRQSVLPKDLDAFLRELLLRFPAKEVELVAFSLGAKIALGLYQTTQVPIDRVVLISPDGLRIHPVYRFCIYNPMGKALFYTLFRLPAFFLFILKALYKLRITDAFKYRFVSRQLDTPQKRALLKRVWQGFSKIRPQIPAIAARSEAAQTEWHVIWGEEDNVLPMKLCEDFIQKVNGAKLHVVKGGHFLLNPLQDEVKSLLLSIWKS